MFTSKQFLPLFILLLAVTLPVGCTPPQEWPNPIEEPNLQYPAPVITNKTGWDYTQHENGHCPKSGESRTFRFAASVSDDSGSINSIWVEYRYIIPEWVRQPLGLAPIYSQWFKKNMIVDGLVTTGGVGNYELIIDAGTEIANEPDFGPSLLGVDMEYKIIAKNKHGETGESSKEIIFCAD